MWSIALLYLTVTKPTRKGKRQLWQGLEETSRTWCISLRREVVVDTENKWEGERKESSICMYWWEEDLYIGLRNSHIICVDRIPYSQKIWLNYAVIKCWPGVCWDREDKYHVPIKMDFSTSPRKHCMYSYLESQGACTTHLCPQLAVKQEMLP